MPTGDILKCELETGHSEMQGRHSCECGYRKYPCGSCGEREVHKDNCAELIARVAEKES